MTIAGRSENGRESAKTGFTEKEHFLRNLSQPKTGFTEKEHFLRNLSQTFFGRREGLAALAIESLTKTPHDLLFIIAILNTKTLEDKRNPMTPLDDYADRIRRLEDAQIDHAERISILEWLTARVIALTDVVVQLLQRQRGDDAANGR